MPVGVRRAFFIKTFCFCAPAIKVFVHLLGKAAPSRGLTHMRGMCVGVAETGVEHCSPAKILKETFLLSYFSVKKSTKSHIRERSPLLYISSRVHELVARAMRGECVRQRGKGKIGSFTALRNLNHTTRANISHEEAEQIRARIVCTPAESARRAWVE